MDNTCKKCGGAYNSVCLNCTYRQGGEMQEQPAERERELCEGLPS